MNTCAKCHQMGNGCCFMKDLNISNQIGITQSDINKIKEFTGKSENEFIISDMVTDEYLKSLVDNIHPVFNNIYENHTRHRLKTVHERCVFLSQQGCELPVEIRPIYCRLYPFWLSPDNKHIIVLPAYECLAQKKSTLSWKIVNEHFGYTEEYIKNLFSELLKLFFSEIVKPVF